MSRGCVTVLLSLALVCATPQSAFAHRTSLAISKVSVSGDEVLYRLSVSAHDLAVALGIETDLVSPVPQSAFESETGALTRYLQERLRITSAGVRCAPQTPAVDYTRLPENLLLSIVFVCPDAVRRLGIDYGLFFDIDPRHRGLGRLVLPDAEEEFLIDRSLTRLEWTIDQPATASAAHFGRIFHLGVEHILLGYDHLLFLLALLMVAARFWIMVKVVTAFTLAHSLTLALAWYGVIEAPQRAVEILIAASIAYVAVENLLGRGAGHRALVAGGFGLVHGLGFYSVLSALGLAGGNAATTLLAFNLGVEAGQLAIVAIAFAPLAWWARQPWYQPSMNACSGVILVVAGFWIVQRAAM